jgi:hypothetical protein
VLSRRHPHACIEVPHGDCDISVVCFAHAQFKLDPESILHCS